MPRYELELYTRNSAAVASLSEAKLDSVEWELNGPGQLDFTISQDSAQVLKPLLVEHEVRCTIEGVALPWQGPIWQDKQGARQVQFSAEGVESYLTRRYIDISSLYYDGDPNGYDQLQIGWGLMRYALGQTVPEAGVTTNAATKNFNVTAANYASSGRLRLRRYLRSEHAEILPLLQDFAGLTNFATGAPDGFEFAILCYPDGRREWTPYFPQRGSLKSNMVLEFGRNMPDFSVSEDGKGITTKAYCTGSSTGDNKLEANYEDSAATARYTQMVSIIDDSSQADPATLQDRARTQVEQYKTPLVQPEIQTVQVPVTLLGVLEVGDRVPVKISRGRTQVDDIFRIGKIKWNVRPNTLDVTLMPKVGTP